MTIVFGGGEESTNFLTSLELKKVVPKFGEEHNFFTQVSMFSTEKSENIIVKQVSSNCRVVIHATHQISTTIPNVNSA